MRNTKDDELINYGWEDIKKAQYYAKHYERLGDYREHLKWKARYELLKAGMKEICKEKENGQ